MPDSFFKPAIKTCSNRGITEIAVLPKDVGLIGSSRQPRIFNPSSSAIFEIEFLTSALGSTNPIPVAYEPSAGSSNGRTAR